MRIRNFNYNKTEVSSILRSGNYLWIAFKGSGGNCTLYKTSAFQPDQIFYTITVPVDKITAMKESGDYIYLAVEDGTYIAARYKKNNPLSTYKLLSRPGTLTEPKSVDITFEGSTNIFILIPGELSGENAKVLRCSYTNMIYLETIDLTHSADSIVNARTMDIDDNNNLWIGTYTNPSLLVRVYDDGGYTFTSWTIE